MFFFFKQKTAYEMRISDWSSDVCSSDLVGPVVPDRARGKLHAVAHDVVLIGEDVERVFRLQRLQLALRHREGVVAEIHLLRVLVIFIHREIDDPAEARSEEHTSELQSLMRISYAVFCLKNTHTLLEQLT